MAEVCLMQLESITKKAAATEVSSSRKQASELESGSIQQYMVRTQQYDGNAMALVA